MIIRIQNENGLVERKRGEIFQEETNVPVLPFELLIYKLILPLKNQFILLLVLILVLVNIPLKHHNCFHIIN